MAKMFYSLDEAAQRLGKSAADVREMASSGQLQEFRDRDKLMFKREQVDLLAGDNAKGGSGVGLGDSSGNSGLGLALEDSSGGSGAIELDDPAPAKGGGGGKSANDRSGISIFDTESTEEGDPSAVTRITESTNADITLDNVGSGSGLLDLTRESDDTSLGADLLEDVYKPDETGGGSETQGASGLFEQTSAPSDVGAAAGGFAGVAMVAAEPYNAPWSGIAGGLAVGITALAGLSLVVALLGVMGAENELAVMFGASLMMWVGIFFGVLLILGILGWLLGKRG